MSFGNLRVLSLESRRGKEIAALVQREGGDAFNAPSVEEKGLEDPSESIRLVERLEAGEFDLLVCMTGVGLAFFRDQALTEYPLERIVAALRRATILSRGPKPLPVLREMGLKADVTVPEPNTWREVVAAITERTERKIVVQEYGRPNDQLYSALEMLGAKVTPAVAYRWELPADRGPLREAAQKLAERQVDLVLFLSSIQLEHLLQIAGEMGIAPEVLAALREYTAVASIGPVMSDSLRAAGLPVDLEPEHPKMAPLVKLASDGVRAAIERKRRG